MAIRTHIPIITLNVCGLNTPAKKHRLAEKNKPFIPYPQETHFRSRDAYRLKVRGWRKVFYANGNQKKAGVPILIRENRL